MEGIPIGLCVEKLPCSDCGSSDGLQSFYDEDKESYYSICFAGCGMEPKGNPYEEGEGPTVSPKTPEEIEEEIQDIKKCLIFNEDRRGIPAIYFRSWGVRQLLSEYDGITPYALAFASSNEGKLCGWKVATMKKKGFFALGNTKKADPFGWERAFKIGGDTLYITEGEYDAIALDYALVTANKDGPVKYRKKMYPVISLTSGGGSIIQDLKKIRKRVKARFKKIVLCLDNDEVGLKAEKAAQSLDPDILRSNKPSGCKDANDAVIKGLHLELARMVQWEAHKPPIEGIVRVKTVLERALIKPVMGLSYPIQELSNLTLGQRFGEAVALGAGVGLGKTVTAHCFGGHNIKVHGMPCFFVLLEEDNATTLRNVCAMMDGKPYGNPRYATDYDQFRATAESIEPKMFMWESQGDQALRFEMDEIIAAIRFNALEYGVKFIYLDNWTRLVDHLSTSEANEFINKYSSEIENLATQLDLHIMTYTHLNADRNGGHSHEEGAEVYANQFTGSKGIMRSFPLLMSFRRNKHADIEQGRNPNNSIISVIKARTLGCDEGEVRTSYQPATGLLLANPWEGELMNEKKKR